MTRIQIPEDELRGALRHDLNATHKSLGAHFGCSDKTIAKELRRHGFRTKRWSERKHTAGSRLKMSRARKGKYTGESNPNYGGKANRAWLDSEEHPFRVWHRKHPDFGDRQRGDANPVHKVRHLYEDEAYRRRITRGLRAHADEKRGSTYEEVYGPEKAAEYREKLRRASPARLAKFTRKETWPEREVRRLLVELRLGFMAQAPLGYYTVDFLLMGAKVVVQADGDFWHANPRKYSERDLIPAQRKRRRLDASCDSFLWNRGYRVVRLWESDLHQNPNACRRLIETALEQHHG